MYYVWKNYWKGWNTKLACLPEILEKEFMIYMPLTYQGCARPVCRRVVMQLSDHDVMNAYIMFIHLGELGHRLKNTRCSSKPGSWDFFTCSPPWLMITMEYLPVPYVLCLEIYWKGWNTKLACLPEILEKEFMIYMPLTYQGCARHVCRRIVMQLSDHDVMKAYTLFHHLLGEIGTSSSTKTHAMELRSYEPGARDCYTYCIHRLYSIMGYLSAPDGYMCRK